MIFRILLTANPQGVFSNGTEIAMPLMLVLPTLQERQSEIFLIKIMQKMKQAIPLVRHHFLSQPEEVVFLNVTTKGVSFASKPQKRKLKKPTE